jgi:Fe2+ or Zn2+ uptake regulation protein
VPFKHDKDVLDALSASDRCLSAYEIAEVLSRGGPDPIRANSVYRCLERLIANGYAMKIVSQNAFLATPRRVTAHERALLVVTCSRCRCYHVQPTTHGTVVLAAARRQGFQPSKMHLEVVGLCASCEAHQKTTKAYLAARSSASAPDP